jgi:hypothetical protein
MFSVLLSFVAATMFKRINIRIVVLCIVFSLLLILNNNTFSVNMLYIFILTISLCHLDGRRLSAVFFVASFLAVAIHFAALASGAVSIATTEIGERIRYTLGFTNANQLALVYLTFVFSAAFVRVQYQTKVSLLIVCFSLIISLPVIYISGSRTSMLSIIMLFVMIYFSRNKLTRRLSVLIAVATPVGASLLTFFLVSARSESLNDLLSNRPVFFSEFLGSRSHLDFLLGWGSSVEVTIDNGFLLFLSATGVILFAGGILGLSRRISNLNSAVIPFVTTMLFASIFESFLCGQKSLSV